MQILCIPKRKIPPPIEQKEEKTTRSLTCCKNCAEERCLQLSRCERSEDEPCVFWIQKSTTNRVSTSRGLIAEGINAVSYEELTLSKAAEKYGISLRSLKRHCQKASTAGVAYPTTCNYLSTYKILSFQDEEDLAAYVKTDVSCLVGISPKEV
ncbi:hypothetical protein AVEN_187239-1 [Araneus ventricosus]|uniref:HTH psq-type domain-containing protein n=1 Tax=Araneus ventricosus TaxID=182803 RepID=A0A4Y2TEJ5_ARAVE|nr:hypothetical protein AVEN_89326-1 [Araneus ventricosus]GBN98424.1 hypothetical protein AVEN_187239-1 [Araneus ventricosus]